MIIEMLENDTGEYRAKVSALVHQYLEDEKQAIKRLRTSERLRTRRTVTHGIERYDCLFCYFKSSSFGVDRLEVFVNGVFTAIVKC